MQLVDVATTFTPDPHGHPERVWGVYAEAIATWEHVLGRPSPAPTETTPTETTPTETRPGGRARLSPRWVEWLMGLPAGWVSDIPIPRTAQIHALGNGVLPAQAEHALRLLITDLTTHHTGHGAGHTGREAA